VNGEWYELCQLENADKLVVEGRSYQMWFRVRIVVGFFFPFRFLFEKEKKMYIDFVVGFVILHPVAPSSACGLLTSCWYVS